MLDFDPSLTQEDENELEVVSDPPVAQVLPDNVRSGIGTLLMFVPDAGIQKVIEERTEATLAVDVEGENGLQLADENIAQLKAAIREGRDMFDQPVSMANTLHKRLTALRSLFIHDAQSAVDEVSRRIVRETRRQEQEAEQARLAAQREADRLAKEAAEKAAAKARENEAPEPIVQELELQAKQAAAPPISVPSKTKKLTKSTIAEHWKSRLMAKSGQEQPKTEDMTPDQTQVFVKLIEAVAKGETDWRILQIDWKYLDKRAKADKSALNGRIPGIDFYDAGSLRGKRGA